MQIYRKNFMLKRRNLSRLEKEIVEADYIQNCCLPRRKWEWGEILEYGEKLEMYKGLLWPELGD